jgi:hypothetical protein
VFAISPLSRFAIRKACDEYFSGQIDFIAWMDSSDEKLAALVTVARHVLAARSPSKQKMVRE